MPVNLIAMSPSKASARNSGTGSLAFGTLPHVPTVDLPDATPLLVIYHTSMLNLLSA